MTCSAACGTPNGIRTRVATLRVRPVTPPADLGRQGGRLADADGAVVPARAPDSLSCWARIGRVVNLLIRRLVRTVRAGPVEAFAKVERPGRSAGSRWDPTSWVHDGYTRPMQRRSILTGYITPRDIYMSWVSI
jgi:hypothetical protein